MTVLARYPVMSPCGEELDSANILLDVDGDGPMEDGWCGCLGLQAPVRRPGVRRRGDAARLL